MRASRSWLDRHVHIAGHYFPFLAVALPALTLATTVVVAVVSRAGVPLIYGALLSPAHVLSGQVWRLATWGLVEMGGQLGAIGHVFALLMIFWTTRDLAAAWGGRRLLLFYFSTIAAAGALTTLIAWLFWPALREAQYLSAWPVVDAMIIAWAISHPGLQIMFNFVIPLSSGRLVWVTIGMTVLSALLYGLPAHVPHFMAEGYALVYLRGLPLKDLWLRLRYQFWQRRWKRSWSNLRPVERPEPRSEREPPRWLH